jgi:hypothetical protein
MRENADVVMIASATDVASWVGAVVGVVSLVIAGASYLRARKADAAVRKLQSRYTDRDILDALDAMGDRRRDLRHQHRAGNAQAAKAALSDWRDAAQRLSEQLRGSFKGAAQDCWGTLYTSLNRTRGVAGEGQPGPTDATTIEEALEEVDRCDRDCGPLRAAAREALLKP